jgi:class 3 adenylate cyclase
MFAAMLAHDQLLRRYMAKHRGYEVKQNGDGFMIAFQRPRDALEFCLGVQGAFLVQKGVDESGVGVEGEADSDGSGLVEDAAEMVENELGLETRGQIDREVAAKRYEDIRLRMSLHHGDVFEQINPVTQRADYMGPSVNRAARYVQATEPGMIVGSLEFVEALKTEWTEGDVVSGDGSEATSGRFEIRSMGMRKFKGVEGREKLFRLMPLSSEGGREEEDTTDSEEQIVGEGRVGGDLKIDEVALR